MIIKARAARIIGEATARHTGTIKDDKSIWEWDDPDTALLWKWTLKEGNPWRDHGRYVHTAEHWTEWPGLGVPDLNGYEVEPILTKPKQAWNDRRVFARVRRLPYEAEGIIIGDTWKVEGVPESPTNYSDDYSSGWLGGATRRIPLYEVALEPFKGKARIVLVHEEDFE